MGKKEDFINRCVKKYIKEFAERFETRHKKEVSDPSGSINKKRNNVFISELDQEIVYYAALVRSFDSSLGNMLETLAIEIAKISFRVERHVEGYLYETQTQQIASLLESYKNQRLRPPQEKHYQNLRQYK